MPLKYSKLQKNISLAPLTTFKIGGQASYFAEIETAEALEEAVVWARAENQPIFILGGGSNILIGDDGFAGLVLKLNNQEIVQVENIILVGAGVALSRLVGLASESSLSGLEWAIGIPGTVGGAVRGNAGAYGGEIKDNLESVKFFDLETGEWQSVQNNHCDFAYRHSLFKDNKNLIIWEAKFALTAGDNQEIKEAMQKILKQRIGKVPQDPSAGSIFKNLLTTDLDFDLCEVYKDKIRHGKLASGVLIEDLGLKGLKQGEAQLSNKHGNIIINTGQATARDVLKLIEIIKAKVKAKYDIELEVEIEIIGY